VRDSAGIRIVESAANSLPLWSLADSHELQLGVVEGQPAYVFDRVSAAFRLADGRIVVADGRPFGDVIEIRYFSKDGRHIRTVGRRGRGPGEFGDFSRVLRLTGDSILIFDNRNRRVTVYDPSGALAYTHSTLETEGMRGRPHVLGSVAGLSGPRVLGKTSDGRFLVQFRSNGERDGYSRDTVFLVVTGARGAEPDTLPRLPSNEFAATAGGSSRRQLPFSYVLVSAPWKDGVLVGTSEAYELRQYATDGRLQMIIRRSDAAPSTLTDDHVKRYLESGPPGWATTSYRFGGVTGPSPKEQIEMLPSGHGLPAYTQLELDDADRFWLRDYTFLEHQAERSSWTIFDTSGMAIARASLPTQVTILHIGKEYLVGMVRDSLRVEYVRVYPIARSK
jgi:hypothetical protein